MDIKTFISKARDYGYHVAHTPEGDIGFLYPTDRNPLTLEIYLPSTLSEKPMPIQIQATSWDAKSPEEIVEVIKAYENALATVELIEEYQAAR